MSTCVDPVRLKRYVQQARDLVRLAVDPAAAEPEARTAALACCRLVATHNLEITSPLLADGSTRADPPRPSASTSNNDARPDSSSSSSSSSPNNSGYTSSGSSSDSRGPSASAQDDRPRVIRVKFDSACRVCGVGIPVGASAQWQRGRGVAHLHCAAGGRS